MGTPEYIAIRIKVAGDAKAVPDDSLNLPSPLTEVYEERHVLANNATITVPLAVSMVDAGADGTSARINAVSVNGQQTNDLNITSGDGDRFRVIIELWRYDTETRDFVFGWPSGTESGSETAWNQIWITLR